MSVIGNVLARQFIYDWIFKRALAGRCKKRRDRVLKLQLEYFICFLAFIICLGGGRPLFAYRAPSTCTKLA